MSPDAGYGLLVFFLLIVAVLWVVLPFAVFGIKSLLQQILSEQKKVTAILEKITKSAPALLLLLAGCTNITATSRSESAVSLKYDDALYSSEQVAQQATAACASYGRQARTQDIRKGVAPRLRLRSFRLREELAGIRRR